MTTELHVKDADALLTHLREEEGFSAFAYKDSRGIITVGFGRNLEANGISKAEAEYLLRNDVEECISDVRSVVKGFDALLAQAQLVCVALRFNVGPRGFRSFRHFRAAIERHDWQSAELELLESQAARLLPRRYQRMGIVLRSLAID